MIELSDLQVRYGSTLALSLPGTLHFPDGCVVAVLGSNGAGKSTLIKAVLGEVAHSGTVSGIDLHHTGVQFQTNSYNPLMRVDELCRLVRVDPVHDSWAERFRVRELLHKRLGNLSGGEKQRITLYLVLSRSESTYIFDELTTGLDFQTRESLMEIVRNQTSSSQVIITTHYFEEVEDWASHVLVLDQGELLFAGLTGNFISAHPHYSLIKVRHAAGLPDDLLNLSERVPWSESERYFLAKDAAQQSEFARRLAEGRVSFYVEPACLYSAYTLALGRRCIEAAAA